MSKEKQLLHLVFGGELTDPRGVEFADLAKLDIVGIFPSYAEAYKAWRAKAPGAATDERLPAVFAIGR